MTLEDNADEVLDALFRELPEYYNDDPGEGNDQFYTPASQKLAQHNDDIQSIRNAVTVQNAETMDTLAALGARVGLSPRDGESMEHFRERIVLKHLLYTSEGTITGLLESAAELLDTSITNFEYDDKPIGRGNAEPELLFDRSVSSGTSLSAREIINGLEDLLAAGYTLHSNRLPPYYIIAVSANVLTSVISIKTTDTSNRTAHSSTPEGRRLALNDDNTFYMARNNTNTMSLWSVEDMLIESFDVGPDTVGAESKDVASSPDYVAVNYHDSNDTSVTGTYLYDRDTHTEQWFHQDSEPDEVEIDGNGDVYVSTVSGALRKLAGGSGSENWSKGLSGRVGVVPYRDEYVYAADSDGAIIYKYLSDGTQDWLNGTGVTTGHLHSTTGRNGHLYVAGGDASAVERYDASDGTQNWSTAPSGIASIASVDYLPGDPDQIIVAGRDGGDDLHLNYFDPSNGTETNTVSMNDDFDFSGSGDIVTYPKAGAWWDTMWKGL